MAVPVLQAIGTRVSATGTAVTPPLPSGVTAGDLLIAFCSVNLTGQLGGTVTGWNLGVVNNAGNISGAWYYLIATGSDPQPAFTWIGSTQAAAQVLRFNGQDALTPIGNTANANANSSTTITNAGVTSTADNALIINFAADNTNNQIPYPLFNWTQIFQSIANTTAFWCVGGKLAVSGSTSTSISTTISTANWVSFGIEVRGTGATVGAFARATGNVAQSLQSYTNNPNVRATGNVLQVLESYTVAIPTARATGNVLQVLRSVAAAPIVGWESNTNFQAIRPGRIKKLTTTLAMGVDFGPPAPGPPPPTPSAGWVTIHC